MYGFLFYLPLFKYNARIKEKSYLRFLSCELLINCMCNYLLWNYKAKGRHSV